jgi:hypothetical protein
MTACMTLKRRIQEVEARCLEIFVISAGVIESRLDCFKLRRCGCPARRVGVATAPKHLNIGIMGFELVAVKRSIDDC